MAPRVSHGYPLRGTAGAQVAIDCEDFAPHGDPILIVGERGTGKTTLAAHLHALSRRGGEFVRTSAVRIPDPLAQGLVYGHAKGSFSGAFFDRAGYVEDANRGTLFLDELGDATPLLQQILMDLLDNRPCRRVGGARDYLVDVRYVFATTVDLDVAVAKGDFRPELRDRLGYAAISLPPLRDHPEEILPLAEACLPSQETGARRIDAAAEEVLRGYPWPGNLRELKSALRFAAMRAKGRVITPQYLPRRVREGAPPISPDALANARCEQIAQALATSRTRREAAEKVGVSRPTFNKWARVAEQRAADRKASAGG